MEEKEWDYYPLNENGYFNFLVEYLEKKKCTKADKLLTKLKTFETNEEFSNFKDELEVELFIEVFQRFE